ncbi:MAG: hypothetical protein IPK78_13825 [Rhodospirillales bacterium]|nr:hypothetical protein [Rhodospirillales bacterium]
METAADLVPADQEEKLAQLGDLALMMTPVIAPAEGKPPPDPAALRTALVDLREAADGAAPRSPAAKALADALHAFQTTDANMEALQSALLKGLPGMLAELTESLNAEAISPADVPPQLLSRRQTADGRVLVEAFPAEDLRDETARRGSLTQYRRWYHRQAARRSLLLRLARRWCSRSSRPEPIRSL